MENNITTDNIKDIITKLEWKPRSGDVIVSLNAIQDESDDLNLSNSVMSEIQHVLAVGEHVRDIKAEDVIYLDMDKLSRVVHNGRDADAPILELTGIFQLRVEDCMVGVISNGAIKLIKN